MVKKYVYIPHSFLVINVCNQGKNLCWPCKTHKTYDFKAAELSDERAGKAMSLTSLILCISRNYELFFERKYWQISYVEIKKPSRCNRLLSLLQNLLFAQHVSGTIMPIIRSSRFIQMFAACGTWCCKDGKWNL